MAEGLIGDLTARLVADAREFTATMQEAKGELDELQGSTEDLEVAQARAAATADQLTDAQARLDAANADLIATQRAVADGALEGEAASNAQAGALERQSLAEKEVADASDANTAAQERMALATKEAGDSSILSSEKMIKYGRAAFLGIGALMIGVAAESVHLASDFQESMAQVQSAAGISSKAANEMGNAFLSTAGHTEQSANAMAAAYAPVAAQFGSIQGKALNASQALDVMTASSNLADAKMGSLSDTTSDLAAVMQAYQIKVKDAASTSDVLYSASNITGQGLDATSAALDKVKTKLGAMAPTLSQTAGLLADMTEHGETGRAAMSALTTTFTTLLKPAADAAKAQIDLKVATDDLPASMRAAAEAYRNGSLTGLQLQTTTYGMSASQAVLWSAFTKASDAAKSSNEAQQELGITTVGNNGKFVGMGNIITQLQDKIRGMSKAQATAELTALGFGSSAAKLVPLVEAGAGAFDKATAAVTKHDAAEKAAEAQAATLAGMMKTLEALVEDYGIRLGRVLIPKLQAFVHITADVVEWLAKEKIVAIGLAAVITGVLGVAVTAFVVNGIGKLITGAGEAYNALLKLFGLKDTSTVSPLNQDAAQAGDTLANAIDAAGKQLILDAQEAAAALEAGGVTTAADIEAGAGVGAEDLKAAAATAEDDIEVGGEGASAEIKEATAAAEDDLDAGGAAAGDEIKASAAAAEDDIEAGGAAAGDEMKAGGAGAEADVEAGGAAAEDDLRAGGAGAEADVEAGGAAAEDDLRAGGAGAEADVEAGGAGAEADMEAGGEAGAATMLGGLRAGIPGVADLIGPLIGAQIASFATGALPGAKSQVGVPSAIKSAEKIPLLGAPVTVGANLGDFFGKILNPGAFTTPTSKVETNTKATGAGGSTVYSNKDTQLLAAVNKSAKASDVTKTTAAVHQSTATAKTEAAKTTTAVKSGDAKAAKSTDVKSVDSGVKAVKDAVTKGKPIQVHNNQQITITLNGKQVAEAVRIQNLNNSRAQGQNSLNTGPGRGTGNA